jgi:hypothetical protein
LSISAKEVDEAVRKQFDGQFIDAADLVASGPVTLTIAGIVPPNVERDGQKKLIDKTIIAFTGAKKRMVACNTNLKVLTMHFGKKASDWIGKRVTLTPRILAESFGERNVPCVRFALPAGKTCPPRMRKHYGEELSRPENPRTPEPEPLTEEQRRANRIAAAIATANAEHLDALDGEAGMVSDEETRLDLCEKIKLRRAEIEA